MSKTVVLLTIAIATALALSDAFAISSSIDAGQPVIVSWPKVVGALMLQVFVVVLAFVAFAQMAQRRRKPKAWEPGSAPWHVSIPLALTVVLASLSVALFFNGLVCGSQPLPTTRGVGLCGR